jgi:hypothetical protein
MPLFRTVDTLQHNQVETTEIVTTSTLSTEHHLLIRQFLTAYRDVRIVRVRSPINDLFRHLLVV